MVEDLESDSPNTLNFPLCGSADEQTIKQMQMCMGAVPEGEAIGALMADNHLGYSMPIGGVIGYKNHVSPSGVGYDIGCGVMAVRTPLLAADINQADWVRIANEIQNKICFGLGGKNKKPADGDILDKIAVAACPHQAAMVDMAREQLGTVGSGNHYVDILVDTTNHVWVATHHGSRGFGFKTAQGFFNLAENKGFFEPRKKEDMMAPPVLLPIDKPIGDDYLHAMELAIEYASTSRERVVKQVLTILQCGISFIVENHHNFAKLESIKGSDWWVVRKGATPARENQYGFVGGSMGDKCVVIRGTNSRFAEELLYSAPHGAGRVMSRNRAIKGVTEWRCENGCVFPRPPKDLKCAVHHTNLTKLQLTPGIDYKKVREELSSVGIIVRGGGADESPDVYRKLDDVITAHKATLEVAYEMWPKVVVMAGAAEFDPYRD